MEIKERLSLLRKQKDFTQAQMAEALEVKRARYNAWEQGISQPDIDMIKKIAKFHNVSVDYLTGNTEMKNAEIERKEEYSPNFRVIQRAATEMTPEQLDEGLKLWNVIFKDLIKNAKMQEGVDDIEKEKDK